MISDSFYQEFIKEISETGIQIEKTRRYDKIFSVFPKDKNELIEILHHIKKYNVTFFVVSNDMNYGIKPEYYGKDNSIVIHLNKLNKIISFDEINGIVKVEPGVTFRQLQLYLEENNFPYLAPSISTGAKASLVGNAIIHGISQTPINNRFESIISYAGILEDGTHYETNTHSDPKEKSYLGDFLDNPNQKKKLVITEMSFKLAPTPEYSETFMIKIKEGVDLEQIINATRNLYNKIDGKVASLYVQNPGRCMLMLIRYPQYHIDAEGNISEEFTNKFLKNYNLTYWTLLGNIHCNKNEIKNIREIIENNFINISKDTSFYDKKYIDILGKVYTHKLLPRLFKNKLAYHNLIRENFYSSLGRNRDTLTSWPYWKKSTKLSNEEWRIFKSKTEEYLEAEKGGFSLKREKFILSNAYYPAENITKIVILKNNLHIHQIILK